MRSAAERSTDWQAASSSKNQPYGLLDSTWFALLLLFGVAIAVRLVGIDRFPSTDELYTVLAARGWVAEGAPQIADGVYGRAELFTIAVGSLFKLFGDSIVVARILSIVAGSLLVAGVFVWTRSVAGPLAAWIAAGLLCFSPLHILMSHFARFYALMGLMLWLGSIGVYTLVDRRLPAAKALLVALGSGLCLLLALHLQVLAAIGIAGLALWLVYAAGVPWLCARHQHRARLLVGLVLTGVLLLGALAIAVATGLAEELWQRYRWSPVWSNEHRNEFWFYQVWFTQYYQSLWPILPFLAILAVAREPAPAIFCLLVFMTGFVLLSFGGMKDRRYVSFLLPYLFVLWGIALAELGPLLVRCIAKATPRALRNLAPSLANRLGQVVVIGLGVLFLIASNGAPAKTLFRLAGVRLIAEGGGAEIRDSGPTANWPALREPLSAWWNSADVILTSHDVQTLYFLGDYDIVVNNNRMSEMSVSGGEFARDVRTGRPVVSEPESLRRILACYPSGLLIADAAQWRTEEAIDAEVADVIEAVAMPVPLPDEIGVLAFRWQHPADRPRPQACATLPPVREAAG